MADKKGSLIPGVLLILIGLWFLARRFIFFTSHWMQIYPLMLLFFAGFLIIETFRGHRSGALFWGITFFFIGLFFLFRNYGIIRYYYADEYWPIFLLALGCGFLALFILNPKEWGLVIPASVFIFLGIGFSLQTFNRLFWGWENFIDRYWPVILIIIGLGVLIDGFQKRNSK